MAKGLVVSHTLGTGFEGYTGTVAAAERAMAVCGNVFSVAMEVCRHGFVPVSHVSYDFAKREICIHFANEMYLSREIYLEGSVEVTVAVRSILQQDLFPALTTQGFVAE